MRSHHRLALGALAAFAASFGMSAPILAQSDSVSSGSVNIRTEGSGQAIVVTGDRELEKDRVKDAVRDIAMRGRTTFRPLARYEEPLCVRVSGLGEELGAGIRARIEANTRLVGHKVGEANCRPNALVLMVDDPEKLIDRMRDKRPDLFDAAALRRIRSTLGRQYPAISWFRSQQRNRYGNATATGNPIGGLQTEGVDNELLFERDARFASRVEIPYSLARLGSVVLFDAYKLDNVHLDQIADYSTMRILGNPQPRAELGANQPETILNLFRMDPLDAAPGLTLIDVAYLQGLYAMQPRDPGVRLERFVLAAYDALREDDDLVPVGNDCASASVSCKATGDEG